MKICIHNGARKLRGNQITRFTWRVTVRPVLACMCVFVFCLCVCMVPSTSIVVQLLNCHVNGWCFRWPATFILHQVAAIHNSTYMVCVFVAICCCYYIKTVTVTYCRVWYTCIWLIWLFSWSPSRPLGLSSHQTRVPQTVSYLLTNLLLMEHDASFILACWYWYSAYTVQ